MGDPKLSARIGMVFFLVTEAMFFAGLLAAYWVLRGTVVPWPPEGQPRLPVFMTGINTAVLLASGVALFGTDAALRKGCRRCLISWLGAAMLGGVVFLMVQGYEWVRLIRFGLTTVKNVYGGTFYLIVGAHGLHVVIALIFFLVIFWRAARGAYSAERHTGLTLLRMYWSFVVLIWPAIYVPLYLL